MEVPVTIKTVNQDHVLFMVISDLVSVPLFLRWKLMDDSKKLTWWRAKYFLWDKTGHKPP